MSLPFFHPGEECYINISQTYPQFSNLECTVIDGLRVRPRYDFNGRPAGQWAAYKVMVEGHPDPVCAPEGMLRKKFKRSDWGSLKTIWQPKREAR